MKKISLFYWSNKRLQGWETENYGDLLSGYIVSELSRKQIQWTHPKKIPWWKSKKHYLAIGSILGQATSSSIVWGSGIIKKDEKVADATFYAVRGPQTRKRLVDLGHTCPEVFGDPALLLPEFLNCQVTQDFEVGYIPHYTDYSLLSNQKIGSKSRLIDLRTNDIEKTTIEIRSCKRIVSSSLHGVIVAHAYGIPAIWIRLSDNLFGDDIKFQDYFESVGIIPYSGLTFDSKEIGNFEEAHFFSQITSEQQLPTQVILKKLRDGLKENCPFI